MNLNNLLNVASVDTMKAVAFAAVFLLTKQPQACIALVAHALCEFAYASSLNNFYYIISIAALYAIIASLEITIKSEIRYLFIMISCVNWLCAVDVWRSPNPDVDTYFSIAYPYLINTLDLIIIYYLLPSEGLRIVGESIKSSLSRRAHL